MNCNVTSYGIKHTKEITNSLDFSAVHENRPCTNCILCKETYTHYTHPVKWKNQDLITFLKCIEPHLNIQHDSCICRNCRADLSKGQEDPENFFPRWKKEHKHETTCEVFECNEPVSKSTSLACREEIEEYLKCPLKCTSADIKATTTHLCDKHYRCLQKELNPENYQWKCVVCSAAIRGSNYSNFRACSEPEQFQKHLQEHAGFQGTITASDKVCAACYRHSLVFSKINKEKLTTDDEDFLTLLASIQDSIPAFPFHIGSESKLIEIALKFTVIHVAKRLLDNHALRLQCVHSTFQSEIEKLLPLSSLHHIPDKLGTPRWLLSQLSSSLQHHMSYTCRVKKHGVILFRQGRELDALSHAMYSSTNTKIICEPDHVQALNHINTRIKTQIDTKQHLVDPAELDIDQLIQKIDPIVWNAICILTQSATDRCKTSSTQSESYNNVKKIRRLFILCQIMFCIDKTCYMPFHVLNADLIDCYGGSAELIKIFNRLGVCVSNDTLLRHIQQNVQQMKSKGILQGLDPDIITVFTLDNIDFLHSHAQVFAGNQHLSWHGTTIQAVQANPLHKAQALLHDEPTIPSETCVQTDVNTRRRSHGLLSPMPSPDKEVRSPLPKRFHGRPRTGNEFKSAVCKAHDHSHVYHFKNHSTSTAIESSCPTIDTFRPSSCEQQSMKSFTTHATSYFLLKNAVHTSAHNTHLEFKNSFQ